MNDHYPPCDCHEHYCRICCPAEPVEIDRRVAAKAKRDHVRALIVAELQAIGVLSAELRLLLRADAMATAEFGDAMHEMVADLAA